MDNFIFTMNNFYVLKIIIKLLELFVKVVIKLLLANAFNQEENLIILIILFVHCVERNLLENHLKYTTIEKFAWNVLMLQINCHLFKTLILILNNSA